MFFEDDSANELRAPALQSWLDELRAPALQSWLAGAKQAGNAKTR